MFHFPAVKVWTNFLFNGRFMNMGVKGSMQNLAKISVSNSNRVSIREECIATGKLSSYFYEFMPWSHLCVKPPRMSHGEPRIAILGIWGDTWLTRGKYGIYVAVRGSYGVLTGSTWRLLPRKISPIYCRVSYVAVTRIPSLVLRADSYEAALRKGVTTAIPPPPPLDLDIPRLLCVLKSDPF